MRTSLGNCDPIGGFCTSVNESICEALHKISTPQWEWIPCSERLPKTGDSILVTYSDGEVGIVWYARPEVWGAYEKATNLIFPIAWMLLPEPYKKDGEDDTCE